MNAPDTLSVSALSSTGVETATPGGAHTDSRGMPAI